MGHSLDMSQAFFNCFEFPQLSHLSWLVTLLFGVLLGLRLFLVPNSLRHLPRVPILPLLWSYLIAETEDIRIRRLILPFANEHGECCVLVWALGRWIVHILDYKLARVMCEHVTQFPKEAPPDDLLLWRFIGRSNVLLSNGQDWKRQSQLLNDAFTRRVPIDQFIYASRKLFAVIGDSPNTVRWDDLAQRFALDAVGVTVLGYDFNAINTESVFMKEYNGIMHAIANPAYLIAPFLERVLPRTALLQRIDHLADNFMELLHAKKRSPGDDMMTFMLQNPEMSDENLRDNIIVLFIAGHDTSAGAISTLIYFLAKNPYIQQRAREEVLLAIGPTSDPTLDDLQPKSMPYLNACIREALRINTSISYIVPRTTVNSVQLGKYHIPASTSLIMNIYAVHHNNSAWADPHAFKPERFLNGRNAGDNWLPFALGPRQCPARNFALYEQRVLATMLLREYEWSLPETSIHAQGLKNAFSPFALTLPYDLNITFSKRPL